MKFTGTDSYVASDDLRVAVNAAIALQRTTGNRVR